MKNVYICKHVFQKCKCILSKCITVSVGVAVWLFVGNPVAGNPVVGNPDVVTLLGLVLVL